MVHSYSQLRWKIQAIFLNNHLSRDQHKEKVHAWHRTTQKREFGLQWIFRYPTPQFLGTNKHEMMLGDTWSKKKINLVKQKHKRTNFKIKTNKLVMLLRPSRIIFQDHQIRETQVYQTNRWKVHLKKRYRGSFRTLLFSATNKRTEFQSHPTEVACSKAWETRPIQP